MRDQVDYVGEIAGSICKSHETVTRLQDVCKPPSEHHAIHLRMAAGTIEGHHGVGVGRKVPGPAYVIRPHDFRIFR